MDVGQLCPAEDDLTAARNGPTPVVMVKCLNTVQSKKGLNVCTLRNLQLMHFEKNKYLIIN